MKKFLLILAMMLPCLGVLAEPTSLTITNFNAGNTTWTKFDGSTLSSGWGYKVVINTEPVVTLQCYGNANDLGWSTVSGVRYAYLVRGKEYMLSVPENYIISNFEFVTENSGRTEGNVTYELQPNQNQIKIRVSSDGTGTQGVLVQKINLDIDEKPSCNYTLTDDAGNQYTGTCYAVPETEPTFTGITVNSYTWVENNLSADITFPFPVSNAESTNKLMINGYTYSNQDFKWYAKENTYIKVNENSAPTNETVNNYLWAIYPTFSEGEFTYTIKNIATEKFITSSATSKEHNNNTLAFSEEGISFKLVNDATYGLAFKVSDKNLYLSINTSTDGTGEQPVGLWENAHDGTSLDFIIPDVINYTLTDAANNIFTGEAEGWTAWEIAPTFTGAEGYTLSNQVWDANTLKATIDFPFLVSSASQSNPMLIGQAFDSDKKMWTAVGGKVNAVDGEPSLGASQWMIYPSLNGTEFTFKIKSVSTEKYVTATSEGVTLTTDGTNFQCGRTNANSKSAFVWTCTNGDETLYVILGSDEDNTPLGVTKDVATAGEKAFVTFQEFISFKVTIGGAGYTTIYSPFPVWRDFSGNSVEIYTIAEQEVVNNKVQLTEMSYYIPGESAAILKGEPGDYVFIQTDDDSDMNADWAQNKLEGSSVNTYVKGEAYVLGIIDSEVGLYKAELNKDANGENGESHFLNNAGKAYLPATAIIATQGVLRFNFGGNTTAIESILNNGADANAPIYDLTGRRVVNAVKGGIYIQNGKKFIVK